MAVQHAAAVWKRLGEERMRRGRRSWAEQHPPSHTTLCLGMGPCTLHIKQPL